MEFADLTEEYTSRLMSSDSLITADMITLTSTTAEATANDPATTTAENTPSVQDATAANT